MAEAGDGLKLRAEDEADLVVLSAAAQDGVVLMRDVAFDAPSRRFALLMNRFRWEAKARGAGERIRSALVVSEALAVKSARLKRDAPEAVAALLAVRFLPDPEPPSGVVELAFAGGGLVRIEVEALDVTLTDIGAPWPARARPDHERGASS